MSLKFIKLGIKMWHLLLYIVGDPNLGQLKFIFQKHKAIKQN